VAELRCEFAAIVYAELYRLLGSTKSLADSLAFRLDEIRYGADWLDEAIEAYESKWVLDLQYLTPDSVGDFALSQPDHAVLATWILAGLRNTGQCHDLSNDLGQRIMERVRRDLPDIAVPLPSALSPVIFGWTLGCVVGSDELPAMPAVLPPEENVQHAFLGFMEHVLLLQSMAAPWPEMVSTATYWRGYGIAEGLLPEHGNGGLALAQLKNEASRSMAPAMYATLERYFKPFNQRRQSVSHVARDDSRPPFVEVAETIRDWPDLRMAVVGLTQFVFQEVSKELQETPPRSIRPGVWDNLTHEIRTDW
jgi:hypothetical protein